MESIDPQLLGPATITTGLGVAMLWLGSRMGLLESRVDRRRCPSCGHLRERAARCPCTR